MDVDSAASLCLDFVATGVRVRSAVSTVVEDGVGVVVGVSVPLDLVANDVRVTVNGIAIVVSLDFVANDVSVTVSVSLDFVANDVRVGIFFVLVHKILEAVVIRGSGVNQIKVVVVVAVAVVQVIPVIAFLLVVVVGCWVVALEDSWNPYQRRFLKRLEHIEIPPSRNKGSTPFKRIGHNIVEFALKNGG